MSKTKDWKDYLKEINKVVNLNQGRVWRVRTQDVVNFSKLLRSNGCGEGVLITGTDYALNQAFKQGYDSLKSFMNSNGFEFVKSISFNPRAKFCLVKPRNANKVYGRFQGISEEFVTSLEYEEFNGSEELILLNPVKEAMTSIVVTGNSLNNELNLGLESGFTQEDLVKTLNEDGYELRELFESKISIWRWC